MRRHGRTAALAIAAFLLPGCAHLAEDLAHEAGAAKIEVDSAAADRALQKAGDWKGFDTGRSPELMKDDGETAAGILDDFADDTSKEIACKVVDYRNEHGSWPGQGPRLQTLLAINGFDVSPANEQVAADTQSKADTPDNGISWTLGLLCALKDL